MHTIHDNVVEQIVQTIFSTMLNKSLVRIAEPVPAHWESLLATVQISGKWMGSVILTLSPEVARSCAVTMLEISDDDVTDADMQDVAAEMANIIGGNVKSTLPGPSFLSMPTIVSGRDFDLRMHAAHLIEDVLLACNTNLLRVRLYGKNSDR
jgi:chemotaxis protein CheX